MHPLAEGFSRAVRCSFSRVCRRSVKRFEPLDDVIPSKGRDRRLKEGMPLATTTWPGLLRPVDLAEDLRGDRSL